MSATAPMLVHPGAVPADLQLCLRTMRVRYDRLAAAAGSETQAREVLHLGAKFAELLGLVRERQIAARDAALLPRLAAWVAARLDTLEQAQGAQPVVFPQVPPAHEGRSRALEHAIAVYERQFGVPPSAAGRRRMDALLAAHSLVALTDALVRCARREGRIRWLVVEALLAGAAHGEGVA